MRNNVIPREHGQLCLHKKKKKEKENEVNLISSQKKGTWINKNMLTATHLLIPSFITRKFIPE